METPTKIRTTVFVTESNMDWLKRRATKNRRPFSGELDLILEAEREREKEKHEK